MKLGGLDGAINLMIKQALKTNDQFVPGKALGPNPRFFIVGDEPNMKDYLTGCPFSGPMNDVLLNAVQTLDKRYKGVKMEDFYVTYLVKTTFRPGVLTEEMVIEDWLPIAQLEYHQSGCDMVVGVGAKARMFTGHIATKPAFMEPLKPTLMQRIRNAWEAVRGR